MVKLNSIISLKSRRRQLRKNQTPHKGYLWSYLRNRKLGGYKFYRQFSFGNYVLDYYCQTKRIAVELDGSQHQNDGENTCAKQKKEYLAKYGVKTLRFWNGRVRYDIDGVLDEILQILEGR